MPRQQPGEVANASRDENEDTGGRAAPETDPTNPQNQESTGMWVEAERASARREDEPGLTDRERHDRASAARPD